jgi:hypothetical protein
MGAGGQPADFVDSFVSLQPALAPFARRAWIGHRALRQCGPTPRVSHIHITFLLWIYILLAGIVGCAAEERKALESPALC